MLERASARETAARVALGRVASALPPADRRRERGLPRGRARRRTAPPQVSSPPATTSEALDADPVRCLDPAASEKMVAAIDQAHTDGDTLGGVVEVVVHGLPPGLGLARPLGPPHRRPAGRRADGDPGDQGRRGRRRVRARRDPRLAGARRDRADRRRDPPYRRPLRRHRGRHDHRRGAAGPGGDEADRHRAARAAHRRRRPPARRPWPTTSAPTSAPCPPRASWPRRWWPWCSPTRCWRSSAATPSPRPGATPRATCDTLRFR